ncbi:MAG: DUF4270 domain-containing protein [Muribaculaceae bacterium]|nr:DUF4270 domain-containing protein [Muribaculaceae bacterium]
MKLTKILSLLGAGALMLGVGACNDDVSPIGGSLASGEVTIRVDSMPTAIESECEFYDSFDGRNTTKLLGRINVPEYGRLTCSFVTQMMAATRMPVPDSIGVSDIDSVRLVLSVPRGSLTGDSLAPQQLRVFALNRQLPSDISTTFSPDGYYDASAPLGARSYTLSNIAKGDSVMKRDAYIRIPVKFPVELGRKIFTQYRTDASVFQWPSTFNQYFPGLFIEQNFGNGCIANISKAEVYTYWHYTRPVSVLQADSTYKSELRVYRDSMCLMASQPEVLSSNVIDYQISENLKRMVADGRSIITTPGGCLVKIKFPVLRLLEEYHSNEGALSVVSGLQFEVPALAVSNSYGLQAAPNLLMVKKSEYDEFFSNNKLPDSKTSFYAAYDSERESYRFNSMREWLVDILEAERNGETIDEEDYEFVLVPVDITSESVSNYDGSVSSYLTRCQPYLVAPTMTELFTDRCIISFTYSSQVLE